MSTNPSKYAEFIAGAEAIGFQQVARFEFTDKELNILAHPDGILLSVDSYKWIGGSIVANGGHAFFHCRIHDPKVDLTWANQKPENGVRIAVSINTNNIQEFVNRIHTLRRVGKFSNPWPRAEFVWLLVYGEEASKSDEITETRIAQLPDWVRSFVKKL